MYKWVDEKGTIHFSDQPGQSGAERIEVAAVTTYNNQQLQPSDGVSEGRQLEPTNNLNRQTSPSGVQVNRSGQAKRIARGRFRTDDGYLITADDKHLGSSLAFQGRVEGGPRCKSLYLRGYLTSKNGTRRYLDAIATDVGGGGRLFESAPVKVSELKEGWEVTSVAVSCQQR
jgi:hypothetical protein